MMTIADIQSVGSATGNKMFRPMSRSSSSLRGPFKAIRTFRTGNFTCWTFSFVLRGSGCRQVFLSPRKTSTYISSRASCVRVSANVIFSLLTVISLSCWIAAAPSKGLVPLSTMRKLRVYFSLFLGFITSNEHLSRAEIMLLSKNSFHLEHNVTF